MLNLYYLFVAKRDILSFFSQQTRKVQIADWRDEYIKKMILELLQQEEQFLSIINTRYSFSLPLALLAKQLKQALIDLVNVMTTSDYHKIPRLIEHVRKLHSEIVTEAFNLKRKANEEVVLLEQLERKQLAKMIHEQEMLDAYKKLLALLASLYLLYEEESKAKATAKPENRINF